MTRIAGAEFRHVLGNLPTGVTVITAYSPDGPVGMAANSVTSVSLEPPLILFCASKSSETWPRLRAARRFCVNVMAAHHEKISRQFAAKDVDRFRGVSCRRRPAGPALIDAVAWIECEVHTEHDAGDHTIVVATVLDIKASGEQRPLVFFRGRYGEFALPAA